ncbi:MAG: hypothetical protein ABI901_02945 [Roseiflexaceae bacterium]
MILHSLLHQGYRLGSGAPVTLLGYSGGGQIAGNRRISEDDAKGTGAGDLLSGVVDAHPAIDRIDALYHLYGTKDVWQRLGQCIFPARWPVAPWSRWNRAVAGGKITVRCLSLMTHEGRHSYYG